MPLSALVEDTLVVADPFELWVAQNFVLDGLLYPLVYERFDAALFRPGRIDYRFELGPLPPANVEAFARDFYSLAAADEELGGESPAGPSLRVCEVCNLARRNIVDPAGFFKEWADFPAAPARAPSD